MTDRKLRKYGGEMPTINPRIPYSIGTAAYLAMVDRGTLRRDADAGIIPFTLNEKNGRKTFLGKDLIIYRNTCV